MKGDSSCPLFLPWSAPFPLLEVYLELAGPRLSALPGGLVLLHQGWGERDLCGGP